MGDHAVPGTSSRCTARRPRDGQPCGAWAIRGGNVCIAHGGAAPAVRRKAAENVERARAARKLRRRKIEPTDDPVGLLQEITAKASEMERLLLDALDREPEDGRSEATYAAWTEMLDRAQRFARDLASLGLEERRVAIAEEQGRMIATAMSATLAAVFGLLREQLANGRLDVSTLTRIERGEAPAIARRELLALVGEEETGS